MDLSICIFFFLLFRFAFFCFYFVFFCFFPGKSKTKAKQKPKKSKSKKQKKATQMQMDKSIFSHFSPFLTFLFFPFILLPVFFGFEVLLFDFPCVFLFFAFFSSLKNIRISYRGGHKPTYTIMDIDDCTIPSCGQHMKLLILLAMENRGFSRDISINIRYHH